MSENRKQWTTTTFLDFVDGMLTDGGVNTYVTSAGDVRLINVLDLNHDGSSDVVLPGSQDYDESVDLFIYWADAEGFASGRKSRLPTQGAVACDIADLNKDRHPDLIVANHFDGERTFMPSYIYWGGKAGYDVARRSELPTRAASAVRATDLNGDGWLDLVFANQGVDYHMTVDKYQLSYVYWGSARGFSTQNRTQLPTINATDVEIADLNRDGSPDIVFANEGNSEIESGASIYWGDKSGTYSADRCTKLLGLYSSAVEVADINGDGVPDLIVVNQYRLGPKPLRPTRNRILTHAVDSYVYWGSSAGYEDAHRTELPTVGATAAAVGDFNQDGRTDLVFANGAAEDAFIYWGSKEGYRSHKRAAVPAPNASDVVVDDLNDDGLPDLIFAVFVREGTRETNSLIYWAGAEGISVHRRTELPTQGARGIGTADLNQDGRKDTVFINKIDGTIQAAPGRAVNTYIYWGDARGEFSRNHRQSLPSFSDVSASADINGDGWTDLVLPLKPHGLPIYWGDASGLAAERRTLVPFAADYLRVSDFNRDGYLDLALTMGRSGQASVQVLYGGPSGFSKENGVSLPTGGYSLPTVGDVNKDGWLDIVSVTHDETTELRIFFNSPTGFCPHRSTTLPSLSCASAELADLNGDGYLDLILVNESDSLSKEVPIEKRLYGENAWTRSFIYWGGPQGYDPARRAELPTIGALDALARDLNQDGYLDLVFANYHSGGHRHYPSDIYWGGPKGYDEQHHSLIPTHSASGILAADFNRDGWQDLLFSNHVYDGNHRTDSFLYWGGPDGFSPDRRTLLPGEGVHFLRLVDVGNIYDRKDRYDYISPQFDAGEGAIFERITWEGKTPFCTGLEFQVRTAATREGLVSATWQGPEGAKSYYRVSGSKLVGVKTGSHWIQYTATLLSPEGSNTPVLDSVTIEYR